MKYNSNKLYNYVFHFNELANGGEGLWAAIPREKIKDYFNNMNDRINTGVLYADKIQVLLGFLEVKE